MEYPIEILVEDAKFPEGPRWHDGAFWYADISAGEICRVIDKGQKQVVLDGLLTPSGLGWARNGDLIFTSILDSTIYRLGANGSVGVLCGPQNHGVAGTNDMATHGSHSYVSCSGYKHEEGMDESVLHKPTGKVLLVDHETGQGRTVAEGLTMPNGIAITPDGRTLVLVDGFANRVLMYDIRPDGSLAGERLFADVGTPMDGMALDAKGGVWVATAGSFRYVDADGRLCEAIEVPGFLCIAPMLGGDDGRTLFMAVTRHGSTDDIFAGKAEGRIVTTRVSVGAPIVSFPQPAPRRWRSEL